MDRVKSVAQNRGTDRLQGFAKSFISGDEGRNYLYMWAARDVELLEAAEALADAHGLDGFESGIPSKDDRTDELQAAAVAFLDGEFPAWWVANYAPIDDRETAAHVADDPDAWDAFKDKLTERYAEYADDMDRETAAQIYCENVHGCTVDEFESEVVEWPEGRAKDRLEHILGHPADVCIQTMERAAETVGED